MSVDLALNRPASASSVKFGTVANAFDGNATTRWGSNYSDPQWISVDLGAAYSISEVVLTWETAYGKAYTIQVSPDNLTWKTIYSTTTGNGGTDDLTGLSGSGRYVRMYGTVRGTVYGYSLFAFSVYGTAITCDTANLALNHPVTASSLDDPSRPASNAVDGDLATRWSSDYSDPQWLQVDLGSNQAICSVTLNWETAYAKSFQIQTSPDGTNWTTVYSATNATGGNQTLNVSGSSGRYVRMLGTVRGTQWGYSLWEMAVYGPAAVPVPPSISSIVFDKASYNPGDTITSTVTYVPGKLNGNVDATNVTVSDTGNRTWTKASDTGMVATFTGVA